MRTKSKWPLSRRDWLRLSSLGVVGAAQAHWFEALAADAAADPARRRSCILLWMSGGPSQIDTFDPKPGHANGGTFKDIATRVAGRADQRASAQAGRAIRTPGHRPLADQQGRGSRPGDAVRPHRLFAARADPLSDTRLAGFQGTRLDRGRAAELRQRRSFSRPEPGRLFARLLGLALCCRCWSAAGAAGGGGEGSVDDGAEGRRSRAARRR